MRHALTSMKTGKATGSDGWRPHELAALPVPWTDALAGVFNDWERASSWPETLRQNIIALVPKAGATHENNFDLLACSATSPVCGWSSESSTCPRGLASSMAGGTKELQRWPHVLGLTWNLPPGEVSLRSWPFLIAVSVMRASPMHWQVEGRSLLDSRTRS